MSRINPTLLNPELVKIEVGEFRSLNVDREKNMEMEMVNLVREREWLRKEVDLLEKTQSYTELVKCSVEEKLGRSERRCEELEEKIKIFEDLRRNEIDELRVKKMESEKAAEFYKSRVDELESRMVKVETALAKVLNVNLPNLDKLVADATDGNGGIGLPKKGGRNLACSGTEEDVTNVVTGRKHDSKAAESKGRLLDKEDKNEFGGASYRISLRCHSTLKTIDVIKDNLHEENFELFKKSCFGNLLKINEFKFQAHVIFQLLLHMDMSASNKERLIFKINSSKREFNVRDFFHITGLRLGKLETITKSSSSVHKDVFQGRTYITGRNIKEAFLNISSCQKGKGELTLKLALLYFLYGTLLPHNTKKIDLQYLYLVEDLQKFNAFPWGRVAYDFFVSSILQFRLRDGLEVTDQVASFDIYGFCHALQAWVYEVMPSVAAYCACRVNNFENITPWILRWSVTRIIKSDDLKNILPLGDKSHLNNTMGKWEELSMDTPHVATPLNTTNQKKRKLLYDNDQMPHPQLSSVATPLPPSTNASTYSSHHLARRLSQAEDVLESLLRKVDQPILDIDYDELPRNGFPWVDDEDDVSSATLRRHCTSGSNLVSTNRAAEKQARALSERANDNPEMNAHLVQSEMTQMQPLVGRCPSSAAVDVMIISDDDDDDNEVNGASDSSQSEDSDDEFLSDRYMNNFVAELKRKALGNEY